MYNAYITKLKDVRPHSNADRLQVAECFGNQVIVSLDYKEDDIGIYFPEGCQLGVEYATQNNLLRKKDENGVNVGGYLDENKRNITALKLRGEISDGLFMPLTSLQFLGTTDKLKVGDAFNEFGGVELCCKYVPKINPPKNHVAGVAKKNKKKKIEVNFPEHIDSPQFKYCVGEFKTGDHIVITEKLEGTSHRSALLPIKIKKWYHKLFKIEPKTTYKDFCGSRRVTINENSDGGFYGTNEFRMKVHNELVSHLTPNMEIFGEIVGWPAPGAAPLMGTVDTTCLKDKEFTKTYGKTMTFHYGCQEGEYAFYIYRICELDSDGEVKIEYSTYQVKNWCEKHGFNCVPILMDKVLTSEDNIEEIAEQYCDGESTLAHHWREGCVIRRENICDKFKVYKNKNFNYKCMKGLATDQMKVDGNISQDLLDELA